MGHRFQQRADVEFAPLQNEVILFHATSKKFCVLNSTSSFIWSQLKEPASSEEIAERLGNSFSGVTPDQAMSDVDSTLREMLALGLIVNVEAGSTPLSEVNP